MRRFWMAFVALALFWLLANLAGLVRPMGLKPFRQVGFPFTVAAWGVGIEEFFDGRAVGLNALLAVVTSAGLSRLLIVGSRLTEDRRNPPS